MLQMVAMFADFEHATIVDCIAAGIERRAKRGHWANGRVRFGMRRPAHRPRQARRDAGAALDALPRRRADRTGDRAHERSARSRASRSPSARAPSTEIKQAARSLDRTSWVRSTKATAERGAGSEGLLAGYSRAPEQGSARMCAIICGLPLDSGTPRRNCLKRDVPRHISVLV
jgi:hypothetical protein